MKTPRDAHVRAVLKLLATRKVVAILGARQVGKTTLASAIAARRRRVTYFDLEDPRDVAKLDEPTLTLEPLRGLVVRTFVERDISNLGIGIPAATLSRFWTMLAHYHGQVWNASVLGSSLGVSHTTVRKYLDLLTQTFVVRQLRPWTENIGKRVVKSPKVYLSDSGLLHAMLHLPTPEDVESHPKLGASWEGFGVAQVALALRVSPEECFFWRTHAGAELDLLIVRGRKRIGFEFKRTDAPRVTPSMRFAESDLRLSHLYVVHAGKEAYRLSKRIEAIPLAETTRLLKPLG